MRLHTTIVYMPDSRWNEVDGVPLLGFVPPDRIDGMGLATARQTLEEQYPHGFEWYIRGSITNGLTRLVRQFEEHRFPVAPWSFFWVWTSNHHHIIVFAFTDQNDATLYRLLLSDDVT